MVASVVASDWVISGWLAGATLSVAAESNSAVGVDVVSSAVLAVSGGFLQKTVKTDVVFAALKQKTIEAYCQTQEPLGKAGGYAIQGIGGSLIEMISGSYTNVVGLPVYETRQLLEQAKVQFALSGLG